MYIVCIGAYFNKNLLIIEPFDDIRYVLNRYVLAILSQGGCCNDNSSGK